MKILFHINSLGRGGAEHVVSILSKEFSDLGHQVIITTQWFDNNEYELDNRICRIPVGIMEEETNKNRIWKAYTRLFRLRKCIKREKPDVVISFCAKANFRSAYALFGLSTPLFVSVRNNPVGDYAGNKFSTWYMTKKAKGCIFQTPDAKSYFDEEFQKKSTIIYNPLDESFIEKTKETTDLRKKEIVNVGRISKQKNQLLLAKSFNEIKDKYTEYELKIYGGIQEENVYKELEQYIKDAGLEDRIKLMGQVKDVPDRIKEASVFVLSSDFEGMPNALIEAMALGIPSISTDCPCGGSKQLIEQYVNGLLVSVDDVKEMSKAIAYLLEDSARAEAIGKEAKKVIEKVKPKMIAREWLDFIMKG